MAAPRIVVRGQAALAVDSLGYEHGHLQLRGHLNDHALGTGLANRRVGFQIRMPSGATLKTARRTTSDGAFSLRTRLRAGIYHLTITVEDSTLYRGTQLERFYDLSKPTVELWVQPPSTILTTSKFQYFSLALRSSGHYLALPVQIALRRTAGPKGSGARARTSHLHQLASVNTRKTGPIRVAIPTEAFGHPGPFELDFRFRGNPEFNSDTKRLALMLRTPVYIQLRTSHDAINREQPLQISGRIKDSIGPINAASVNIEVMGQPALSTVAKADGTFHATLATHTYPPGPLDLVARFTPVFPWRNPGQSDTLTVLIKAPLPIPLSHYLLPTGLTALLLLAAAGLLHRRRLALLMRWFFHRRASLMPSAKGATGAEPAAPSGLRPGLSRHLRRQDFGITGTIWDPVDQRPVTNASIDLSDPAQPGVGEADETNRSDDVGFFAFEGLSAGALVLTVRKNGYVTESSSVRLPHRGSLRGMRIELVPVRVRVLELYRKVALPQLPDRSLWAHWTPRELLRHALPTAIKDPEAFRDLTLLFEQSYWASALPDLETLKQAKTLAKRCAPQEDRAD